VISSALFAESVRSSRGRFAMASYSSMIATRPSKKPKLLHWAPVMRAVVGEGSRIWDDSVTEIGAAAQPEEVTDFALPGGGTASRRATHSCLVMRAATKAGQEPAPFSHIALVWVLRDWALRDRDL
jgi:hypothetical protein